MSFKAYNLWAPDRFTKRSMVRMFKEGKTTMFAYSITTGPRL